MTEDSAIPGRVTRPEPGLRAILAPNPSPMTHAGTNTYILGTGDVAVIDPGPRDSGHLAAILAALQPGERVSHILVTHSHADHSSLARPLAQATGAPVLGFGPSGSGRSAAMTGLADLADLEGGEGLDSGFAPDQTIADGDLLSGADWRIEVLHTPGHLGNHLCFAWGTRAFTGDHVMGWSTSLVSPPDGDMGDYLASLDRLRRRPWQTFYPGHGPAIADTAVRLTVLTDHRRRREREILSALADAPSTVPMLARRIYRELPVKLLPAAERNVFAHLLDLVHRGQVTASPEPGFRAVFGLARR